MAQARRLLTRTQVHGTCWRNKAFPDYPVRKERKVRRDYRACPVRKVLKACPDYPARKDSRDSPVYRERLEPKDRKEFRDLRGRLVRKDLRGG